MYDYDLRSRLPSLESAIERFPLKVTPDTLLTDVLALMSQISVNQNELSNSSSVSVTSRHRSSCALVVENSELVGLLTERDIVRLTAQGRNFQGISIAEVMTHPVLALTFTDSQNLSSAIEMMRQYWIRHLPIVDRQGQLIGIVNTESIRRILQPSNLLKLRRVEEVMARQIVTAPQTASILSLSQLMTEHQVSCVVITEVGQTDGKIIPVGIVTERDIVQFQRLGMDLNSTQAATIMSAPLVCISPEEFLWQVQQEMERLRIRRLVVTDSQGELKGIVTQTSMLKVLDPTEVYGVIETLQQAVNQQTTQLQQMNRQLQGEIGNRQQAEAVLRESEQILKLFVENAPAAVAMFDRQMRYVVASKRWPIDTGLGEENIIGRCHYEVFPDLPASWKEMHQRCLTGAVEKSPEELFTRADGSIEWLRREIYPWYDSAGEVGGIIMFVENITERKLLEENLRQNQAQMRAIFAAMTDIVLVINVQKNELQIMPTTPAISDESRARILDATVEKLLQASQANPFRQAVEQALERRENVSFEYSLLVDNDRRWFSANISLISEDSVIWVARDITQLKQVEEKLDRRLKFEEMLSGISTYFINLDLDKIDRGINRALQTISKFFEVDRSYIFLFSDLGKKKIRQIYQWCAPGVPQHICDFHNLSFDRDDTSPWWTERVRQLKVCQISDVASLPPEASIEFLSQNIRSFIVLPITDDRSLLGVVRFDFLQQKRIFSEQDIAQLRLFGELLGNVMERKWSEQERQRMSELLFQEKELAQVTLQSIGDAVITTDAEGKIEYFNPVAEQLTGWKGHQVKGILLTEIFKIVNEVTRQPVENPVEKVLREGRIVGLANHTILIAKDGTEYAIDDSAAPIRDRNGHMLGVVLVFHDVTQSRQLERDISWQANHDALTGLVNRRKFEEQLKEAILGARNAKQEHALAYVDLDQFKVVNDTCGHVAGDELLRQVTHLLQKRVRNTDILARLGGDEFGLLLYQCPLDRARQIVEILRQIIQDFRFSWDGKTFTIGASVGLVGIDCDTRDLSSLLSAADSACYAAKEKGRNCIHIYRPDDCDLMRQRGERHWIARIHKALEENRFRLYCQKISPIHQGSGEEHYEVLLRLVDEEGKLIAPMAFIPAAERYDLMPAIDRWVISNFFDSYADSHVNGSQIYTINLSGASVNNPEFFSFLEEQFAQHAISPEKICFEITETTAITNLEQAAKLIHSLKEIGCRFALDDFGSGMSSLVYLKNLPVDYLKIDGSFVRNIADNPIDYAMVESFNQISHVMGIQTIAEFVENESILEKLREIGVDYAQGYCIDRPSPCLFK
jgi:diguanylate cyclase (GGDEF)-like protein/PAS domain S-box-containing protein